VGVTVEAEAAAEAVGSGVAVVLLGTPVAVAIGVLDTAGEPRASLFAGSTGMSSLGRASFGVTASGLLPESAAFMRLQP
jgi:hypothetical protein